MTRDLDTERIEFLDQLRAKFRNAESKGQPPAPWEWDPLKQCFVHPDGRRMTMVEWKDK